MASRSARCNEPLRPDCPGIPVVMGTIIMGWAITLAAPAPAQESALSVLADAQPVPRVQIIPLPDAQASFQVDGQERTRYHFGPSHRRPFLYPVIGPSGRSLTRMGHPRDPVGHSHHNSVWIAHHDVDGEAFWNDQGPERIAHRRIIQYTDGDDEASLIAENAWLGAGERMHLRELQRVAVRPLADGDWLMTLDLQFEAPGDEPVTLGATAFGPIGVRMAKTIGVHDGGGMIRNSEGQINEDGMFRKPARWVDYSGPITRDAAGGITLFDHPSNPRHPPPFHVRDDGWMGASPTLDEPLTIEPGQPLRLRYGLYVHGGVPTSEAIEQQWSRFAETTLEDLRSD